MAILIPNMELPKERGLFLLIGCDGTVEQEVSKLGSFPVYNIVEGVKAIELPPHGQLIDADELLASDAIDWGEEAWNGINHAPTVLEAGT